jgi:hypothetical protein
MFYVRKFFEDGDIEDSDIPFYSKKSAIEYALHLQKLHSKIISFQIIVK